MPRGANVTLARQDPLLRHVVVGVRWDAQVEQALADNLSLAAILCDARGKARTANDFVYFNQIVSQDLSVAQVQEVLGEDVEQLDIDLSAVPETVGRIVVVLYVNEGSPKRRTLGGLRRCHVRLVDGSSGQPVADSENLAEAFGQETAVVLGEVYRHRQDWKFKVVGQGYSSGLAGIAELYGLGL